MNVVEAIKRGLVGQRIKRKKRDEWLIVTGNGSEMRWVNNRQRVSLTVDDVLADDWLCEEDMVVVSRCQVEEAFELLDFLDTQKKEDFMKHLGFKWTVV